MPLQFFLMLFGLGLKQNSDKNIILGLSYGCKVNFKVSVRLKRYQNYLFCHHLEKDIEDFITNTNNALHHPCKDKESMRK